MLKQKFLPGHQDTRDTLNQIEGSGPREESTKEQFESSSHGSWRSCQTRGGRKSEHASEVFLRKGEGERLAGCLAEAEREVAAAARARRWLPSGPAW